MDALEHLAPVSEHYASLPIADAFDWTSAGHALGVGAWYLVAFRSVRRIGADEARLAYYDELAHLEAEASPGFVHYFKGPTAPDGSCLSFCMWEGREHARNAAAKPAHTQAISLLAEMYERYELEFLRVTRTATDTPLAFAPYDAVASSESASQPPIFQQGPQPLPG